MAEMYEMHEETCDLLTTRKELMEIMMASLQDEVDLKQANMNQHLKAALTEMYEWDEYICSDSEDEVPVYFFSDPEVDVSDPEPDVPDPEVDVSDPEDEIPFYFVSKADLDVPDPEVDVSDPEPDVPDPEVDVSDP